MSGIIGSNRSPAVLQFLSAAVDAAGEGILAYDTDFRLVLWNFSVERIFGISPDEVLGKHAFEVFPFLLESGEHECWRAALRGEHVKRQEQEYSAPGNRKIRFDAEYRPIRNESGEILGGTVHLQDSSKRLQTETASRELIEEIGQVQDRLKLITSTTGVGTWYCDLPFDVLHWSNKTKEHFWLSPDAHVTIDTFYQRIHPEDRERTRQAIAKSIAENTHYDIDYRTVSETGEVKWIRAIGRTFYDAEGQPISFDGFTVDQTERRNAEDTLRKAERLATAGRLAATVAHEVNNPLEAVTNLIYLCQQDRNAPQSVRENLAIAESELSRVAHIVRQTLGFYRETTAPELTDISRLVRDLVELYERRFSVKRVELRTDLDDSLVANVVAGAIRQVVANLISNAMDACAAGDSVTVSARCLPDNIHIKVADTGHGIAKEHRHRLFEPFFTTKRDVGTGLGLWVSKGIIEKHRGTLSVETSTDRDNHGTVVTIALPLQSLP